MPRIHDGGYTFVLRESKVGINPEHLKPYQEKLKEAAKICAEKTKNFKGAERVRRMNACVAELLKKKQ